MKQHDHPQDPTGSHRIPQATLPEVSENDSRVHPRVSDRRSSAFRSFLKLSQNSAASRFTAERFTDVPPLSFDFKAEALGLSQSMHVVLSGSGL